MSDFPSLQILKPSAASKTPPIEPFKQWKEEILFSMDRNGTRKNPIAKWAVAAMRKGYKMFAVQDGAQCIRPLTSTADLQPVGLTVKANDGQTRST